MANKRKKNTTNNKNFAIKSITTLFLFIFLISAIILKDKMGIIGEVFSKGLFILFGLTAYILPLYIAFMFFALLNKKFYDTNKHKIVVISLLLIITGIFLSTFYSNGLNYSSYIENSYSQALNYTGVGIMFTTLYFLFNALIADIGIYIFTILIYFASYFYLFDKSMSEFFKNSFYKFMTLFSNTPKPIKKNKDVKEKRFIFDKKDDTKNEIYNNTNSDKLEPRIEPKISYHKQNAENKSVNKESDEENGYDQLGIVYDDNYQYTKPPMDLLNNQSESKTDDETRLLGNADIIVDTLESFGISSEVVNINNGPTVTSYEVKPQSGIKVSKIVNLSNNLAMALASPGIRIEAPIPGKPYVGIEVPNQNKDIVTFKSLISTDEFQKEDDDITVAVGKDLFGKPLYAKINEMPHLLIAGATGSGKSVLMNVIIMSIIYKYSPNEVEFIMIDPKMVELKIYSGIPHLKGRKVVTKAQEATASLYEAVKEMTTRFEKFSKNGCRDIKSYNKKVEEDNEDGSLEKMPYLVVIIDELSDLMMEASKDVENYITRLAQMGRASGVHLLIATQRPSVNVITGIIKANIPSRIAFQVASNIDSRTIIDMSGAEKLLGKGDMLYYPGKLPKPKRAQGAFLTDSEVERVVTFVKNKNEEIKHDESFNKVISEAANKSNESVDDLDELFDEAVNFVISENQASISAIQRRFRVGYARAGRIIDQMTRKGIVSEQDGSKPRNILKTLEEIEMEDNNEEIIEDESTE
ncbi:MULTISPECIES: DNA translocase FtsK 4TM domain-containing protein [Helcococcus]|uniref:DNA translocase FtsK 4TM domain-containing protein n=1 Tax=Helcococcus bovis TaxID=3153252 RepID=A0ABW9F635_9FIRM